LRIQKKIYFPSTKATILQPQLVINQQLPYSLLVFFLAAAIGILAAPVVRGLSGVGEQTGGVSLRSSSISASISGVHGLYRAALSL